MNSNPAQAAKILALLKTGKSITPLLALRRFGCFRLSGRIWELKERGIRIVTRMVSRNGKRFASYSLSK